MVCADAHDAWVPGSQCNEHGASLHTPYPTLASLVGTWLPPGAQGATPPSWWGTQPEFEGNHKQWLLHPTKEKSKFILISPMNN